MSQENVEIVQEFLGCVVIAPDGTRVLTHPRGARPVGAAEAGLAAQLHTIIRALARVAVVASDIPPPSMTPLSVSSPSPETR